jgi:chorismate mutase
VAEETATPGEQGATHTVAAPQDGVSRVPLHELLKERGQRQTAETELATARASVATLTQRAETAEAAAAAAQAKATAYEQREATERAALIESIPEADRPIAQAIADPARLADFVARVKGGAAPLPVRAGQPGGATGPTTMLTPAEIAEGIRTGGSAWLRENAARIPSTG